MKYEHVPDDVLYKAYKKALKRGAKTWNHHLSRMATEIMEILILRRRQFWQEMKQQPKQPKTTNQLSLF